MADPKRTIDIHRVARLARLTLTQEEAEHFAPQLQRVLDHIAEVNLLDTANLTPTSHTGAVSTPLRADTPRAGLPRAEVLAQAPRVLDGAFVVPKFVEET